MYDCDETPQQVYWAATGDGFTYDPFDESAVSAHRDALRAVLEAHPVSLWNLSASTWTTEDVGMLVAALCWYVTDHDTREACDIATAALGLNGRRMIARYRDRANRIVSSEQARLANYRQERIAELRPTFERIAARSESPAGDVSEALVQFVRDEVPPDDLPTPRPAPGADPVRQRVYGGVMLVGSSPEHDRFEPHSSP